jgi:large conductance mechanosensitive channel
MLKEFRDFINRGNVLDLATAVIIGTAFTAIVNSLVNDIIMPLIGILLNGLDFSTLVINVGEANLSYGNFIQAVINFLLIALVVFLMVRGISRLESTLNKAKKQQEQEPPAPSKEELLLTEIRDLLKEKS